MQIGYIVARAYASDAELPIENATFSVITTDEQNQELIGIRVTDENGKTDPIPVETPDESLSTSPGNADPFTRVNVRIDHPEYNSYFVKGVQVFAGQVSLVNAPMIPTALHISFDSKSNSFDTNEQNTL